MPDAATLISTSPAFGCGVGRSASFRTSGAPNSVISIAFICVNSKIGLRCKPDEPDRVPVLYAMQSTLHFMKNGRRAFALPAVVLLPHYCGVGSPCGAPFAASFSNALADKRTRPFSSVWMTLTFTCWPSFR